jgi:hypothetical protein
MFSMHRYGWLTPVFAQFCYVFFLKYFYDSNTLFCFGNIEFVGICQLFKVAVKMDLYNRPYRVIFICANAYRAYIIHIGSKTLNRYFAG